MHLSVPKAAQEFPAVQEQEQGEGQSWDRELERVRERAKSPAVTACLTRGKDQRKSSPILQTSPALQEPYGPRLDHSRQTAGVATSMAFLGSSLNEMESNFARTVLPFWQPANTGDCLWLESALQARAPDASCGEFLKKIQEVSAI